MTATKLDLKMYFSNYNTKTIYFLGENKAKIKLVYFFENFSFFGQKLIFDQIKTKFNQHEDKVDSQFKLNSIVETKFNLKFKFQI